MLIGSHLVERGTTEAHKELERLQKEVDQDTRDSAKVSTGGMVRENRNQNFDAVLTGAGMLLVLGLAIGFASRLTQQQVTSMTAGSVGASAGLLVGYAVGRRKNG